MVFPCRGYFFSFDYSFRKKSFCKDSFVKNSFCKKMHRRIWISWCFLFLSVVVMQGQNNGTDEYFKGIAALNSKSFAVAQNLLQLAAQKGSGAAMQRLGLIYQQGNSIIKVNQDQARYWYMRAAVTGSSSAMFSMGWRYRYNNQMDGFDSKAFIYWFSEAAKCGHQSSMEQLSRIYMEGIGVPVQIAEAKKWAMLSYAYNAYSGYELWKQVEMKEWMMAHGRSGDSTTMEQLNKAAITRKINSRSFNFRSEFDRVNRYAQQGIVPAYLELGLFFEQGGERLTKRLDSAFYWYERAAEGGSKVALMHLMSFYDQGLLGTKDSARSMEMLKELVQIKSPAHLVQMGVRFFYGRAVKKDVQRAKVYFEEASKLGSSLAFNWLAHITRNGFDGSKDSLSAMRYYEHSALLGDRTAMVNLAAFYEKAEPTEQHAREAVKWYQKVDVLDLDMGRIQPSKTKKWEELYDAATDKLVYSNGSTEYDQGYSRLFQEKYQEAIVWFRRSAQLGYPTALYQLGELFEQGRGLPKNMDSALQWYLKAALEGYQPAERKIMEYTQQQWGKASQREGIHYAEILFILKQYSVAKQWYEKLSENGDGEAMCRLGDLYSLGLGFSVDVKKGMEWYRKSADLGNPRGMFNMAAILDKAEPTPENKAAALRYYMASAQAGYASSMVNLGRKYEKGEQVEQSDQKAMDWYVKAAQAGHEQGMYNVAVFYDLGKSVAPSLEKAMYWYEKAASLHHQEAIGRWMELMEVVVRQESAAGCLRLAKKLEQMKFYGEAYYRLHQAVEKGSAEAARQIGEWHHRGFFVERNLVLAKSWYEKAIKMGATVNSAVLKEINF